MDGLHAVEGLRRKRHRRLRPRIAVLPSPARVKIVGASNHKLADQDFAISGSRYFLVLVNEVQTLHLDAVFGLEEGQRGSLPEAIVCAFFALGDLKSW